MKATTLTGKALLASVLSLTLCFAMLLGTTFAWFTDKVTTGANQIISGDLEVALLDKDGNSLENSTTLFRDKNGKTDNLLWEPNATIKTLDMFVKNDGNLALKYKLILNVTGADAAKLLEVLAVTVTVGDTTVDLDDFEGKLMPAEKSDAIVITTHMDQNADESYENLKADLSLTVLATQLDAEFDSLGNDYDKDVAYADHYVSDAASLQQALNEGGIVALESDIDLSGATTYSLRSAAAPNTITVPADKEVTLDLNGHNITASSTVADSSIALITVAGKLNVVGNGTIALYDESGESFDTSYRHATIVVSGGEVNLEKGVTVICTSSDVNGATAMSYAVDVMPQTDTVVNVNGANLYSSYIGVRLWALYSAKGTVNYNSGIIQGEKKGYDLWVQGMDQHGLAEINVAEGLAYTTEDISGTIYLFGGATFAPSEEAFKGAMTEGGEITLGTDVQYGSKIQNDVSIDLAGNTFEATGSYELGNNADLTMKGGDYVVNGTYGHVDVRPSDAEGSVLLFEDVDFSFNQKNKTYGPCTNRLGSVVEVCATAADAKTVIVFRNCTFNNAQILFEGLSGTVGEFDATFENCTFNALTSSAPIEVQNYVKGTITVKNCTFNLTCTSSTASAISISSSTSTSVTLNAENNVLNAVAATPYTFDASLGETEVDSIKINGTPANIKLVSAYENSTVNVTGTTVSGIAVAN